ncbi:sensor domain-containing diguanylate cyclase [Undibacterium sp.]|uniref:GGDEF domain-containing protein n=1 Tax=Undibacterium sp. TaxID=1914977 RepID=UPI002731729D|nr:sensor domain-containing diguanylate cyclase [Undibacterium sp.]MDP1977664.1 diguanylate cyclase [Undibacterium sp.]
MSNMVNQLKSSASSLGGQGGQTHPVFRKKLQELAWALFGMGLYYLAARTGMHLFALKPSNITLLWLASGIGLVMCMRHGLLALPLIIFASFWANYPGMAEVHRSSPLLYTLISATADGMAGIVAMLMMRLSLPGGLTQAQDLLHFGIKVCLIPTMLSSLIISLNLAVGGYIGWDEAVDFFRMLVLADSLGILLIYPLYQAWSDDRQLRSIEVQRLVLTSLGVGVLLYLAFRGHPGFIYFILPVLLLLAFYVNLNLVTLILAVSMVAIIAMTGQQLGPFQTSNLVEANFMLVCFVCTTTFTILAVALHNRQLLRIEAARQEWQQAAEVDALTGLINRAAFLPMLEDEHQRAKRMGRPYALALLDIDHFKTVNDVYGHQAGDEVLTHFASMMQANIRGIDKAARLGGDEFAILFPESSASEAIIAMERLRQRLESHPILTAAAQVFVTSSIGITEYHGGDITPDMVRTRADQLLYAAKHAGRNRVMFDAVTDEAA